MRYCHRRRMTLVFPSGLHFNLSVERICRVTKRVLRVFFTLLIVGCCYQCQTDQNTSSNAAKDGVFIHIGHGSDDVHRVLMALQMAAILSEDKDVLVYFDIKGIEVVLKDAEDLTYSHFPSSKTQIQKLLSRNVPIMACPGCLKAAGKGPSDFDERHSSRG